MTVAEWNSIEDGESVFFYPRYLGFPMPGTVKTIDGIKGIWINFFGDAQCLFSPMQGLEEGFAKAVTKC